MANSLRVVLQLPAEQELKQRTGQAEQFSREFNAGISRVNQQLRVAAAQASSADFQAISGQRLKLYEAFQKASQQIDPRAPSKAERAIQRVNQAVSVVEGKASELAQGAQSGQDAWLKREGDFDDALRQIGELEDAGHPKAAAFRKLGDAVRVRVNGRNFSDATNALDQLRPKLELVLAQAQQVDGAVASARDGASADDQQILNDILKLAAERLGIDVEDLGDLTKLPKDVLDLVREIAALSPAGLIAGKLSEQVEALLSRLFDIFKDIIEKRRVDQICVVTVTNNTDETLEMDFDFKRKRGGWSAGKFPERTLGPRQIDTFQAESPENMKVLGVHGFLTYTNKDGLKWELMFRNPRDAKVQATQKLEQKTPGEFESLKPLFSVGDEATFDFELRLVNDPNPTKPEIVPGKDDDDEDDDKKGGGETPVADGQASCLVTINNNSSSALTLLDQGHDVGDFMTSPPPTIAAGGSALFVSVETPDSNDSGVAGFAEWEIEGGGKWMVRWNNPEQAKNTTESTLAAGAEQTYRELDQIGQGDENVPVTFTLSESGDPAVTPPVTPGESREGLTVLVRDSASGDAIEGASVTVGDQTDATSSRGLATVELPVGRHQYEVTAQEYQTVSDHVEIIKGDNPELIVEMYRSDCPKESLTVVVEDEETGEAIPNADVTVGDASGVTSDLGIVTLELPVGPHAYVASAETYRRSSGNTEVVEGDNEELVILLAKEDECDHAALAVIVIDDETSAPIADASVTVGEVHEQTSAAGLSVLTLEPGTHDYEVLHADYAEPETGTVDVAEGDDNELTIRLRKDGPCEMATLAVIVVDDETSAPLANATVNVGDQTDQTSAAGLSILNIEPGQHAYEVTAEDPAYSSETGSVEVVEGNDNELTIRLKKESPGATVTFHVTDKKTGEPLPEANIRLGDQPGQTDANGQAQFAVEAGDFSYVVLKESYGEAAGDVEARADSNVDEYVELEQLDDFVPPSEVNEPTLRKGDESVDGWVEYLQKLLHHHGYTSASLQGNFDQQTYDAVRQFQTDTGCLVDGIVGNETWSALREDPERAPVGVDDRPDEHGPEGRWGTEAGDVIAYFPDRDELLLTVVSVGDQPIDDFQADVFIDGKRISPVTIGPPTESSATGAGHTHAVQIKKFMATYGPGVHEIDAYLPQELGGDHWTGQSPDSGGENGENGGNGGGGGGTTTTPTETATLEVRVVAGENDPVSGAKVRISTGPSTPPDGTTDSAGIAKFDLLPGEYHVNAAYRAYVFEPVHIKPGDLKPGQTRAVTMSKIITGGLDVTVLFDGAPAAGATVSVSPSVHAAQTTSSIGYASFELAAGQYEISAVSSDGQWSGAASATVASDEATSAIVELVYGKDGRTRSGGV